MVLDSMKAAHIAIIKKRQREILFLFSKEISPFHLNILEERFGEGKGKMKRQ